jgi:hypothetical protein
MMNYPCECSAFHSVSNTASQTFPPDSALSFVLFATQGMSLMRDQVTP